MRASRQKALALVLFLAAPAAPALACEPLTNAMSAYDLGNESAAAVAAETAANSACSVEEQVMTGRIASVLAFNRIASSLAGSEDISRQATELELLRDLYKGPWQVFDALGDIYRQRGNYTEAARLYEAALSDADNRRITPDWMAPDAAYIRRMDRLATEMRLVEPGPLHFPPRNTCKASYRGVTVTRKTAPVRFIAGSAKLTADGEKAASDLARCIRALKPSSVLLTGHTEPVGTEAVSQILSERKAQALAAYLKSQGVTQKIETVGKGASEPFMPDQSSTYDLKALSLLDSRVDVDLTY